MSVRDTLRYTIDADIFAEIEKLRAANEAYETQKAEVEHVEHMRKQMLAAIKEAERKKRENMDEKPPANNRLDDIARASEAYKTFLGVMHEERKKLAVLQAKYWGQRDYVDALKAAMRFATAEKYLTPA